ncbi:uncharacterized protein A4U43_C04F20820 [Asparagus officinalis]|uniref:Uncharacterized protein n=1 Tax=Asparagus officinalis TaxID=4686 RepID=A0A5P1F4C4_ASPOF|nr:uncharacterized protein A4U43_C04F20820 [Asparagus officinalis]
MSAMFHNETSQTQKKRGRGYDKPKWVKSGKESIAFTEDGLCVDPKDAQLSRRFLCGDHHVDRDQWRAMVNYWDTDLKNKVRCENNIESRKRQKMNHTGGTKSLARHMADYVKISRELTSLVETHGEETSELRQQAYVAARGLETRGRVRGYGRGVMPEMIPWVAQTQPTSSSLRSRTGRAYANLQSQYSELKKKYERRQKELDELKQMITSGNAHPHQQCSSQQQSNSQQRSPSQQQSPSEQIPTSCPYPPYQHRHPRSPSQEHSPSQHTPMSYSYHPYQHLPPNPYTSSSQFYYPHPYQPPLYHPVPHPPGEFTAMLNDSDFIQQMMPPNNRNDRDKS